MNTAIIKPQWSFITITLMVLGFIIFWPLGLAMLAYILWGERYGGSSEKAERWIHKQKGNWKSKPCRSDRSYSSRRRHGAGRHGSGNAAFDEYREEQLERLNKERQRLDDEINHFHEHMRNLRMARDRDEFDRFMQDRGDNQSSRIVEEDDEAYSAPRKSSKAKKVRKD